MSEEEKALAVLDHQGLTKTDPAPVEQSEEIRDLEFDRLLTGRPDPVKFDEPGQFVTGVVVEKITQQKKDFDSGELLWHDDGSPKLEPVVILNTDDGLVTLYMSSWRLAKEIGGAIRAAGARRLERGGTLAVRFTGFGEPYKKGAQPPKEYEAAYDPPGVAAGAALSAEVNAAELGPPPRTYPKEISVQCTADDHRECDSRKCVCECHRASKPPAQLEESAPEEVPF